MPLSLNRRSILTALAGACLGVPGLARAQDGVLSGAGSSFVGAVMKRWIEQTPASIGMPLSYAAVGSGNGQNKILAREVDFALSDDPMAPEKLANGQLIQFPFVFGGVTCVVNLPGLANEQLQLTGELLAGIYGGAIKTWSDPKIAAANAGVTLPDLEIRPVNQSTPNGPMSGTTYTFTQYLLATNADWRAKHGTEVKRRWAVGSMVATADNMTETMKVLTGAIGYVPIAAAVSNKLTTVKLMNKSGNAVAASSASLAAAVNQVDWTKPSALLPTLIDLPGDASWPITVVTYGLIPRMPRDAAHGEALKAFFKNIVANGGETAAQFHAAVLPASARPMVMGLLDQVAA